MLTLASCESQLFAVEWLTVRGRLRVMLLVSLAPMCQLIAAIRQVGELEKHLEPRFLFLTATPTTALMTATNMNPDE